MANKNELNTRKLELDDEINRLENKIKELNKELGIVRFERKSITIKLCDMCDHDFVWDAEELAGFGADKCIKCGYYECGI